MEEPRLVTLVVEENREASPERLLASAYDQLRRLAVVHLRSERANHTLQPTALVHETYLRLTRRDRLYLDSTRQFLAVAAQMMRRVLVDHARRRSRLKRCDRSGSGRREASSASFFTKSVDLLDLESLLRELAELDQRAARAVELRFFGGLSVQETAEILGVSDRTIRNDWIMARAWLARALKRSN